MSNNALPVCNMLNVFISVSDVNLSALFVLLLLYLYVLSLFICTSCLFVPVRSQLGGAISGFQMDLEARDCDVVNNVATTHGGGLRLSYRSSALMIRGNVSYNRGNESVHVLVYLTPQVVGSSTLGGRSLRGLVMG